MDYTGSVSTVLEVYTLEDILEFNDLTEEDVLLFLVENKFVTLPNPRPVDLE